MTLTRSIPFVMSRRSEFSLGNSQLIRSVYHRASGLICQTDAVAKIILGYQPKSRVDVIAEIRPKARVKEGWPQIAWRAITCVSTGAPSIPGIFRHYYLEGGPG